MPLNEAFESAVEAMIEDAMAAMLGAGLEGNLELIAAGIAADQQETLYTFGRSGGGVPVTNHDGKVRRGILQSGQAGILGITKDGVLIEWTQGHKELTGWACGLHGLVFGPTPSAPYPHLCRMKGVGQ